MPNVKGATRKPTAELALSGAIDKNPKRHANRKTEPQPLAGIGNPPKHFDDEHAAIWHEIATQCAPGVLFNSDRLALEQLSVLIYKSRFTKISSMERAILMSGLQQFGFTPASRSRIAVEKPKDNGDSWQNLLTPPVSIYKQ